MADPLRYLIDNVQKLGGWLRAGKETRFHLNRALWDAGYPWTRLQPEPLTALFPGIEDVSFEVVHPFRRSRGTSLELEELVALLAVQKFTKAMRVIEVGTFDGNTTLNLAANVDAGGLVVTLDLPPEGSTTTDYAGTGKPAAFAARQYVGHPAEARIRQVYGDSAALDWSSFGGTFDLAFLDGDHSTRYVRSDTQKALGVLRPGGLVVWHDYEYRSVSVVLDAAVAAGEEIHWIRGTRLAVGRFPDPAKSAPRFAVA